MPYAVKIPEQIDTNIMGPAPISSIGGKKYLATWIEAGL